MACLCFKKLLVKIGWFVAPAPLRLVDDSKQADENGP
jgi:hypothetical protein